MDHRSKYLNNHWRIIPFLASLLLLFSCNTTKYLQEEEAFLKKNKIKFESTEAIRKKKRLRERLFSVAQSLQKPNDKVFGINRRWFFYKTKDPEGTSKFKNLIRRMFAEVPSVYEKDLAEQTRQRMVNLLYEEGYYDATVHYQTEIKNKKAAITYSIQSNDLYTVDTIVFVSRDSNIQKVLNEISSKTVFQKGEPVSNQLYKAEQERITLHLKNIGYREFILNYFDQLSADSSGTSELKLQLEVFPVNDTTNHKIYRVGEIYVYPSYYPNAGPLRDSIIEGLHFLTPDGTFEVRPDIILKRIYLKKGQLYSQENYHKTIRNLGELGVFKFANINDQVNKDSSDLIDFKIYLPPSKKLVLGGDIEIKNTFFSEATLASGNFIGGELSLSYKDRNLLGGAEEFDANFSIGGEFGTTGIQRIFNTYDINPQFGLSIPKFSDPLRFVKLLNDIGIFTDRFYNSLLENANTRINLGLHWSNRRDYWGFFSGNVSLGYEIQNNPNRRYYVNQFGLNIFNPNVPKNSRGEEIFQEIPFLERSFNNPQLFTGLFIKDFGFAFSGRNNRNNDTWRFFLNSEVSGLEVLGVNALYNEFKKEGKDTFQLFGLDYAQFVRLDLDGRYYKYISNRQSFAFRLNTGIAIPFGFSPDVPYVKQFYAGGPNSVRAWRIRELGPGSYQDPSTFPEYRESTQPFYQTGDFKFIFSAEYRFKLFKIYALDLEGAFFLDGGNVWTLKKDPSRPGAELSARFLRQIALGTGIGFRMDFDYFKLSLDLGYKIRNPYPNPEGSYWAYQRWRELKLRGINWNLAVGYPF